MRIGIRSFVALWYLLGWISHVYLGLFAPTTYRSFGETALFPAYTNLWQKFVMPHITFYTLLLAVFEIVVGYLLVSKGMAVKIGVICSILFNIFLVQMGLGYIANDRWQSFMINRAPNMIFVGLQMPLLWGWDEKSVSEAIKGWFLAKKRKNQG